jgi:hypothetical protein
METVRRHARAAAFTGAGIEACPWKRAPHVVVWLKAFFSDAQLELEGIEMSKLRKAARGRDCQVRIPGVCNHNPETTVLAHLSGAGMGRKANDLHGAWACSDCHDVIDGRRSASSAYGEPVTAEEILIAHLEGVIRTQEQLIDEGLIKT